MAYNENEVNRLKPFVQEIISGQFSSDLHEMRKKLIIAVGKDKENNEPLDRYEKILEEYRKCHDCHKINVELKSVATQTDTDHIQQQPPLQPQSQPTQLQALLHILQQPQQPPHSQPKLQQELGVITIDSSESD